MRFALGVVYVLFTLLSVHSIEISSNFGEVIQIAAPVNHSFVLEFNNLQSVLENDAIKDRHVVIVSIAGALRQGKSFLLKFFVRYLTAQVNDDTYILYKP